VAAVTAVVVADAAEAEGDDRQNDGATLIGGVDSRLCSSLLARWDNQIGILRVLSAPSSVT
jgi:hypothetical protein